MVGTDHSDDSDSDSKMDNPPSEESIREIISRLKDVRSRILREIYYNGGEASTTQLRSETGGNVPSGSLEWHLKWLRGEAGSDGSQAWWPDDVGPLIHVARRENREHTQDVRIIGLTPVGEYLVEQSRDGVIINPSASVDELRDAVMAHSSQIHTLSDSIEENADDIEEARSSLENKIDKLDREMCKLIDYVEGEVGDQDADLDIGDDS